MLASRAQIFARSENFSGARFFGHRIFFFSRASVTRAAALIAGVIAGRVHFSLHHATLGSVEAILYVLYT